MKKLLNWLFVAIFGCFVAGIGIVALVVFTDDSISAFSLKIGGLAWWSKLVIIEKTPQNFQFGLGFLFFAIAGAVALIDFIRNEVARFRNGLDQFLGG